MPAKPKAPDIQLTWDQVWARRLERHSLLSRRPLSDLVSVVGEVCGIHAQVMPAAEISIGIRVDDVTRSTVQNVLWQDRALVKTFGLRGTVHIFPSEELPLWLAALRVRSSLDPNRFQNLYLTPEQLADILHAIEDVSGDRPLLLDELGERIVQQVGSWASQVLSPAWSGTWPLWRKAIAEAAVEGILCYGPPQGNKVTFVRADQWLHDAAKKWEVYEPEAAIREVLCRYLSAYGPATSRDFAQWFSIPPRYVKDLAAGLTDELAEVDVEGYRCLMLKRDMPSSWDRYGEIAKELPVHLLPHFDCYVIGCHPRKLLLHPEWTSRVPPRSTPSQLQELLVDGMVAGLWERELKGGKLHIRVEAFEKLTSRQHTSLEQEAEHIGSILGAPVALAYGPVAARPHL